MNNFLKAFTGNPQDRHGIITPKSDQEILESRRGFLTNSVKLVTGVAVVNVGLGLISEKVEAAPNMELRKELIDNHTIFTSKENIIKAFKRYEEENNLTAFNFYYPRYIGEHNPNVNRIARSLIVSKVMVKNLDDRIVEIPLLNGEVLSTLSEKIVVKAEIVGGDGWVILPAGTQIITSLDGKRKIAACRNEIFEEIKEEEKKCIPKCVSFRCNYPETIGGQKTGIVATKLIPAKGDVSIEAGKNICQAYVKDNLDKIKDEFNSKK